MNDLELEIRIRVAKYEPNHYISYEDCEKIAWDIVFPKGHKILRRHEDNDYQGKTSIDIESEGKLYHCEYWWGSCSGCDTLQGNGHEEAIKMIIDGIKLVNETNGETKHE